MATLMPDALDDLVELSYDRAYKKKSWIDISLTKEFYTLADRYLQGKKMPMKGGPKVTWKAQVRNTKTARFTGLFSKDQYDVQNLMDPAVLAHRRACQGTAIENSSCRQFVCRIDFIPQTI